MRAILVMLFAYGLVSESPHRISRRRSLRQAQGGAFDTLRQAQGKCSWDGSASATPPQGGSDWSITQAGAVSASDLVAGVQSEAALGNAGHYPYQSQVWISTTD